MTQLTITLMNDWLDKLWKHWSLYKCVHQKELQYEVSYPNLLGPRTKECSEVKRQDN